MVLYGSYGYIIFNNSMSIFLASRFDKSLCFDNELLSISKSLKNNFVFNENYDHPLDLDTRNLISKSKYGVELNEFINMWKIIISKFDKINMLHNEMNCMICYENCIDSIITSCNCVESNSCLECLLIMIKDYDSRCPFCRKYFDPFDIRLLKTN